MCIIDENNNNYLTIFSTNENKNNMEYHLDNHNGRFPPNDIKEKINGTFTFSERKKELLNIQE